MRTKLIFYTLFTFGYPVVCSVPNAQAALTLRWMGNTGFTLTDGKTTLLFDPAVSSVPLYRWALPFLGAQSDPAELEFWGRRCGIQKVDATFVNHTHTDHAIDAPAAVQKWGGFLAGSESLRQIGLGHGLPEHSLRVLKHKEVMSLGSFQIQAFETPHSPHFWDILLSDGEIEAPLRPHSSPWDYRVGQTFSYWITHPEGKLLFQATGRVLRPDPLIDLKPDTLLLTIANRLSSEDLLENRVAPSGVTQVIPLHWDNFFKPLNRAPSPHVLWFQALDEFKEKARTITPRVSFTWPEYCQEIRVGHHHNPAPSP